MLQNAAIGKKTQFSKIGVYIMGIFTHYRPMNIRQSLNEKIKSRCEQEGISVATLSSRIFGQWRILPRFVSGGDIKLSRAEEAVRWMEENNPAPEQKGAA